MISMRNVSKIYVPNKPPALDDCTVEIEQGEFVFLVGHSGSGKSTFIRLLLRELLPTRGQIIVAGQDLTKMKNWKVPFLRRNIGCVFQDFKLLPNKTTYENIAFALEVIGLDPVRFLVWPKLLAMVLMVPCLTVLADFVGIVSGGVFSSVFLGIDGRSYFQESVNFLRLRFFYTGLIKSLGFAVTITLIGCWQGFLARDGAVDVGLRTTRAVVQSIFVIVLLDLFFTAVNYLVRPS